MYLRCFKQFKYFFNFTNYIIIIFFIFLVATTLKYVFEIRFKVYIFQILCVFIF